MPTVHCKYINENVLFKRRICTTYMSYTLTYGKFEHYLIGLNPFMISLQICVKILILLLYIAIVWWNRRNNTPSKILYLYRSTFSQLFSCRGIKQLWTFGRWACHLKKTKKKILTKHSLYLLKRTFPLFNTEFVL